VQQGDASITHLTPAELEQAVRAADPAVFFVLPRVLRRVIKQDVDLSGLVLTIPHRKSYAVDAGPLLEIVDRNELSPAEGELPGRVILLPTPSSEKTDSLSAEDLLAFYWRLLFHMRVHTAYEALADRGGLTLSTIRDRIQRVGPSEFHEIRLVLQQENLLLPPWTDQACYVEFAALYAELRYFAPSFLPRFFPGLKDISAIDALLAEDVDLEMLYRAATPAGATPVADRCEIDRWSDSPADLGLLDDEPVARQETPSESECRAMMRKSQRPASVGNVVRAAIYRAKAARCAPPEMADRVRTALKGDITHLIRRLQAALELDDASPQPWQDSLLTLVGQTLLGFRNAESRLLYDLQKVCVDHKRETYTVDLVEWALSFGRRPIKRPLPNQRDVLMVRHLRTASGRLAVVHLSEDQREQLALLLHEATERVETRLRERLRPVVAEALDDVGLIPQNVPERVARKKLIEELLDQIVDRGFLTMGILRDAISRNDLKLPDLSGPRDFFRGDPLLRADRRLAVLLDGVYHRGEFYLRGMQRLSSLAFGTRPGRFLTQFVGVPFGGAYVVLAGLGHLIEMFGHLGVSGQADAAGPAALTAAEPIPGESLHLTSLPMVVILGLFVMGLIHSPGFRHGTAECFRLVFRLFHAVVVEPVRMVIRSEWLQRVLHSRIFVISFRFLVKPFLWTALVHWLLPWDSSNSRTSVGIGVSIFLGINLLLNSRVGRNTEELIVDWLVQAWRRFGLRLVIGSFWFVVDGFKRLLETVEWLMYSVDEWLRFRSGQNAAVFWLKAALGTAWFFVAYVVRFSVNLLIEPQINPIKHFPVVTVSHKLLLPLIPSLAGVLEKALEKAMAWSIATAVIFCIPGIIGFLVWELKENWRLYAANRRKQLAPALIGSHNETMARFLKIGFHSGTLPKRFAKLRRAERRARTGRSWHAARKQVHVLHHAETSIRRFVEREFNAILAESPCWQGPAFFLKDVYTATTSVTLVFSVDGERPTREPHHLTPPTAHDLQIVIAVQSGWLVADIVHAGWIQELSQQERTVLATALVGLYKSAGIDIVRQQVSDAFRAREPRFDVSAAGLVVWPERGQDVEVLYDLHNGEWIAPQAVVGLARRALPTLEARQLLFNKTEVLWDDWVDVWSRDCADRAWQDAIASIPVLPTHCTG
jgi:hypothetical protein